MASSVRRLVAIFESHTTVRAAVRTATRAPAAITTTRVSTLIEFYGASSAIASSSVDATDAARSTAPAAVETLDPRWSIQLLDAARFAEFQYGYSGFDAPALHDQDQDQHQRQDIAALDELEFDSPSHAVRAEPAEAVADRHRASTTDIDQGLAALKATEELHDDVTAAAAAAADNDSLQQQVPLAELPAGPVQDAKVKSYCELLLEVDGLLGRVQDTAPADTAAAVAELTPSQTQQQVAQAAAPQVVKSRLFDFQQSAAFVGQCAQARQRRSSAAAKPQRPLWKL